MVAKVSNLFECPRCKTPMSTEEEKPEKCPKPDCKFRFRKPGEQLTTEFHWPRGLGEQFFEMKQVLIEKFLDKPLEEIIPSLSKEEAQMMTVGTRERIAIIEKKLSDDRDKFIMNTQREDVDDLFKSLHYLMTMAIPIGDKELAIYLVNYGKQIGKMAKVLEKYINAGGRFDDSKTNTGNSGSSGQNPSST